MKGRGPWSRALRTEQLDAHICVKAHLWGCCVQQPLDPLRRLGPRRHQGHLTRLLIQGGTRENLPPQSRVSATRATQSLATAHQFFRVPQATSS